MDLEALLVGSSVLADVDLRLPNLAREWLAVNSGMVMKSRLQRMQRHLNKLGRQHRTEFTWETLDEFIELANVSSPGSSKRASSPPNSLATAQLTLRNLFGINARADVMLHLLSGATGSSSGIARATWFDQKAVYRVLESWSNAGLCLRPGHGTPDGYGLPRTQEWWTLLGLERPVRRVKWGMMLFTLLTVLQAASTSTRAGDAYLISSLLRDLHGDLTTVALPWDVTLPDPRSNPGEEYFQPAARAVLKLVAKLAGE